MAENLFIPETESRAEKYQALVPQLKALLEGETDLVANLANVSAALKEAFDFFWVGFYIVKNEELVLGSFQGPIACTRIKKGKGVCGTCWEKAETLIVDDVDTFPGHIACSNASKSEIVVPGFNKQSQVALVLDVDSDQLADFSETDKAHLEQIMRVIESTL